MMHDTSTVRPSRIEQEWYAQQLRRHLNRGTLSFEEYANGLERAIAAHSTQELSELLKDLPPLGSEAMDILQTWLNEELPQHRRSSGRIQSRPRMTRKQFLRFFATLYASMWVFVGLLSKVFAVH